MMEVQIFLGLDLCPGSWLLVHPSGYRQPALVL